VSKKRYEKIQFVVAVFPLSAFNLELIYIKNVKRQTQKKLINKDFPKPSYFFVANALKIDVNLIKITVQCKLS